MGVSGGVGTPEEGEECAVDGTSVVSRSISSSISSDRRASDMCARKLKTPDLIRRGKAGELAPECWNGQRGWAESRTASASEPVYDHMRQNEPPPDARRGNTYR